MVPFGNTLHEADTLALCRIRDNQVGFAVRVVDGSKCLHDVLHAVAVHRDYIPAEGRPALSDRVDGHHVFRVTADLQVIAVDYSHKVVQMIFVTSHSSLINAALTLLAVTHQYVCLPFRLVHFGSKGHTYANAQSMS